MGLGVGVSDNIWYLWPNGEVYQDRGDSESIWVVYHFVDIHGPGKTQNSGILSARFEMKF